MFTAILVLVAAVVAVVGYGILFGAPYVPSHSKDVDDLFDSYRKLKPSDVVVDLGSGDGKVLRAVSRRGAKAVGYEINYLLVATSRILSRGDKNITIIPKSFWSAALPEDTTVIYTFSVLKDGKRLERKLQNEAERLGKGVELFCYGSPLPTRTPVDIYGAFFRYQFEPLHTL